MFKEIISWIAHIAVGVALGAMMTFSVVGFAKFFLGYY